MLENDLSSESSSDYGKLLSLQANSWNPLWNQLHAKAIKDKSTADLFERQRIIIEKC